jgi:hypothetical protein
MTAEHVYQVRCDGCDIIYKSPIIRDEMKRKGWTIHRSRDFCPKCSEDLVKCKTCGKVA